MMNFLSLTVFSTTIILARALASPLLNTIQGTVNSTGVHNGYFYTWAADAGLDANYTNLDAGTYSVEWHRVWGELAGGKGWNPGSWGRVINYNGTYSPNGNSIVGVYGWTRNPLVEYYIVEGFGVHNPAVAGRRLGKTTCNGINYDIYNATRVNAPSIEGTKTFKQYWSVRFTKGYKGAIDTGCHFDAWKNVGMELGETFDYQIFVTSAYYSGGKAAWTIS